MFIDDVGTGPAVLLLHGSPTDPAYFHPLVEALRSTRRVLVPHFPGYGKSPPIQGRYDVDAVHASLEDSLRALELPELAVVGYSGGGYRALNLALNRRLPISRLVLLGAFAGFTSTHALALQQLATTLRGMHDFRDPAFRKAFGEAMLAPLNATPQAVGTIATWLDSTTPVALAEELDALTRGVDFSPRLGELTVPVLLRTGEFDAATPMGYSEALKAGIAGAVLQRVPGCGHALLIEDREATMNAVVAGLGPESNA